MFTSSIQFLGNISEKTVNLVKPITRSVKGIPNAFAIGYTQSKINRHAKKAFKAQQPTVDPKQMEIDFSLTIGGFGPHLGKPKRVRAGVQPSLTAPVVCFCVSNCI